MTCYECKQPIEPTRAIENLENGLHSCEPCVEEGIRHGTIIDGNAN